MTLLYPQNWTAYLDVLQVFFRLAGFFVLVPGFSHPSIPAAVRAFLALSLSLALYPMLRPELLPLANSVGGLAAQGVRELAIGLLMGFAAYLTFEAINLAAHFVGYQIGFGTAGLFDFQGPEGQGAVSVLVPLHGWLALMVFFSADLHHHLLRILVLSFELTRNISWESATGAASLGLVTGLSGKLFVLAVQMAAPLTLVALLTNVAIGVVARLLPQMNVLLFSFPITILLGLVMLYWLAPEFLEYLDRALGQMSTDVMSLLRTI